MDNIKPIPPFKRFCGSLGAFPEAFSDAMSVYESLEWLYRYLGTEVVPKTNEAIELTKQLKEYVEHYFDNLDVQEEINNKLDEMAESGQLSEIIAAYLEVKSVLAFDTPDDVKTADNLISGSYAKTYGYKRKGDGVYDYYIVRPVAIGDVDDGYNVISLTEDPSLVAIRLQQGSRRLIKLAQDDDIQEYLDLECEKDIVFPKDTTITVNDALIVNSNTTIDLNGSSIVFDYDRSEIFDYDWDETLGFMSYAPNSTFTEWNGYHDITIKNGEIEGGCSCFLHSKNVLFEGVEFQTSGSRHSIEFAACANFVVKDCNFYGARDDEASLASELINIDHCSYGGQPYIPENSPMWDGSKSYNVLIESNTFHPTSVTGLTYNAAVGTHGNSLTTDTICQRITIRNNDFRGAKEYAIGVKNYDNFHIYDNTMINQDNTITPSFILKRGSLYQGEIHDNVTQGIGVFFNSSNPTYSGTNLDISNNVITSSGDMADSQGVFYLMNIHNSSVTNNTIEYKDHAIHINTRAYYDDVEDDPNDHSINITIANNVFEKTSNQAEGKYWNIRMANSDKIKFISNQFIHNGSLEGNWVEILPQGTNTNLQVKNNNTDKPKLFVSTANVTSGFSGNNAIYSQSENMSSTSTTGNLTNDIKNFSKLILSLGETTNTQNAILLPYLVNGNKFDSDTRTLKASVVKNDGTYGTAVFTYDGSGSTTSWTYSGDLAIRHIWTQD